MGIAYDVSTGGIIFKPANGAIGFGADCCCDVGLDCTNICANASSLFSQLAVTVTHSCSGASVPSHAANNCQPQGPYVTGTSGSIGTLIANLTVDSCTVSGGNATIVYSNSNAPTSTISANYTTLGACTNCSMGTPGFPTVWCDDYNGSEDFEYVLDNVQITVVFNCTSNTCTSVRIDYTISRNGLDIRLVQAYNDLLGTMCTTSSGPGLTDSGQCTLANLTNYDFGSNIPNPSGQDKTTAVSNCNGPVTVIASNSNSSCSWTETASLT